MHERARALPFFNTLETTLVQLGLVGTIWGFLLIGWRMSGIDLTKGTTSALRILLDAFGTALLSTFTGVVLAYIFAPLVRHLWVWLHELRPMTVGAANLRPAVVELSLALQENVVPTTTLTATVAAAREPTEKMTGSIKLLGEQMELILADLKRHGKLDELETWVGKIVTGAQSVVEALNNVTPAATALSAQIQRTTDAMASRKPLAGLESRLDQTIKLLNGLQAVLGSLERTANLQSAALGRIETAISHLGQIAKAVGSAVDAAGDKLGQLVVDSSAIRTVLGEISVAARGQVRSQSTTNEILTRLSGQIEGLRESVAEAAQRPTGIYPLALVPPPSASSLFTKGTWWRTWLGGRRQ
jgi:MotA/TolQ/ExbB proton channel family